MGASNVKTVLSAWSSRVRDPAFRVLVAIALTTKDDDDPPVFWGGQEPLATALGRRPPFTAADLRAVDRAMSQLRTAGAIVRISSSAPGHRARHELRLEPPTSAADPRVSAEPTTVTARRVSNRNTRRGTSGEHPSPGDETPAAPWQNTRRDTSGGGVPGTTEEASHPWPVPMGHAREAVVDLHQDDTQLARVVTDDHNETRSAAR